MIALICTLAVLPCQDARPVQQPDRETATKVLQSFAKVEEASLFIDLPDQIGKIRPVAHKQGEWSMIYMAAMFDRDWRSMNGVQLFVRRQRTQPSIGKEAQVSMLRVLNSLSDEDLSLALKGELSFGSLSPSDRADVLGWAFNWRGVASTSAPQYPQETFEAFRDSNALTRVRLTGLKKYVAQSIDGRRSEVISPSSMLYNMENEEPYVAPEKVTMAQAMIDKAPADGKLDFGSGVVLTVKELLSQSSLAFGLHYRVDERAFDDSVFISGRYTKDRFEACMKAMFQFEPFRSVSESEELAALSVLLADRMRKLDPNLLPELGDRRTLQELATKDKAVYDRLLRSGINVSLASVTVEPGFFLQLDPGVKHYLGSEDREFNGVVTTVRNFQRLGIGIGF